MKRWVYNSLFLILIVALLYGCTASPRFTGGERPSDRREPEGYTGSDAVLTIEGVASYYAHDFHGRKTANGETYDMYAMTAAHKTFPFGTVVRVHNLSNGKYAVVRINDRGPFVEGRIIDLSLGAAQKVGMIESGTARVRLEVLQWGEQQ